ncbi:MAG: CRISPR-associated endonuclease Cas2 [Candidatus Omnitrophica bacterium]|nr:CRISPR-associated endonuclease Cas2 [Candidatus Omnitrophota bacterium]
MHTIFIYDIDLTDGAKSQRRLNRMKKIGRKYLTHVQKSVFEGEITPGKIVRMEKEVKDIIDKEKDSVIFYIIPDGVKVHRKLLTNVKDPSSNVL